MNFFQTLNNNLKHDIWGNYQQSKQLGAMAGIGYLARKSVALAKAVYHNKKIMVNDHQFFDTWNQT